MLRDRAGIMTQPCLYSDLSLSLLLEKAFSPASLRPRYNQTRKGTNRNVICEIQFGSLE